MGSALNEIAIKEALATQKKDAWAQAVNNATPGSFNISGNKAVWANKQGVYTPLRAYGATHLNPEGLDASYAKALKDNEGITALVGMLGKVLD